MNEGKLDWFRRTPTLRRELLQLVVMGGILFVSTYQLYLNAFSYIWREPPHGIAYHLTFGLIKTFQWPQDPVFVLPTGIILGLVALITADDYKRTYGVMLFGVIGVGGYVLSSLGTFVPNVDWLGNVHFFLLGIALGVLGGTVRWNGWVPRPGEIEIPLFGARENHREYPKALPRLLVLLGAVVVYTIFERWLIYRSPIIAGVDRVYFTAPEFVGVHWPQFGTNLVVGGLFLASLYYVREYSKDQTTIVVGPTGSGKSTLMAGLYHTLSALGTVSESNPPVRMLRRRFRDDGFDGIPSTERERVIPLEVTFRHGYLFPKKVTIRSLDYAGDHITDLAPRDDNEVITADADEAFAVAEYLCWEADRKSRTKWEFFSTDPGGKPPDVASGPASDDADLASMSEAEQAAELINDMLYHSETIGLILPMDMFADRLKEGGTSPSYVSFEDGEFDLVSRPKKLDKEDFLRTYQTIYSAYKNDTSLFYILSFADIALRDYGVKEGLYAQNWAAFTDHLVEHFIPETDVDLLEGMFPDGTKYEGLTTGGAVTYDASNVIPIHFQIEPDEDDDGDVEPVLQNRSNPILRGTRWLSERMGRTKGLKLWG